MPCILISICSFLESSWFRDQDSSVSGDWGQEDPDNQDNRHNLGNNLAGAISDQPRLENGRGDTKTCNGHSLGHAVPTHIKVMKTFRTYLPPECHRTYSCVHCQAHLANHDELISKSFQGSQGRAYLFNSVVNVGCGPAEERVLLTGLHAVADIYCDCCKTTLGWKYEHAFESSQKYKEGKFIIEVAHMIKENDWEKGSWKSPGNLG